MSGPSAAGQAGSGAVEPVRDALLRAARADAEATLADALRQAEALLDEARARAEALLAQARRQGEADGRALGAAERLRARREARARTLIARNEAYQQLRRRVSEQTREVRRLPQYPQLRAHLADRARHLLGPDASVEEHPDGGVVALAPGRRADLSLAALATRALDRFGAEVPRLWAP